VCKRKDRRVFMFFHELNTESTMVYRVEGFGKGRQVDSAAALSKVLDYLTN
jgi:hypothetical protein